MLIKLFPPKGGEAVLLFLCPSRKKMKYYQVGPRIQLWMELWGPISRARKLEAQVPIHKAIYTRL